ncbi:hypothetical protein Pcinc_009520 [Petrolisthes cinctipes]|uniref:Serpin domain-containing protein n=1 Tax=Petrolisthes cinctipes TaxID=88211 RepID=A0AAE1G6N0_PETCI|nr:hypothetical protein Pcinc_009520 [Petrolisthes cinctipes]
MPASSPSDTKVASMHVALVLVMVGVFGVSCALSDVGQPTPDLKVRRQAPNPPPPKSDNVKLGHHIQEFGLDLSAELRGTGNQVVSPLSVAILLSSLMLATNSTYDYQLQEALYLPVTLDDEIYHSHFQQLLRTVIRDSPDVIVNVANGLFVRQGIRVYPDFVKKTRQYYNTTILDVDFSQGLAAQDKVNNWVSRKTQGMIPRLITEPFSPLTTFVIANTIFFNGTWETTFNPSLTAPDTFQTTTGPLEVQMMSNLMPVLYSDVPDFDAHMVALPYKGRDFAMFILMRRNQVSDVQDLDNLELSLTTEYLNRIINNMTQVAIHVSLPRMRLTYKSSLKQALKEMQITSIFDRSSGVFNRMTNVPLWVDDVIHETVVEVTETGTKAASATAAGLNRLGSNIKFRVDRPALYFIRSFGSDIPLFWGRLMRPESLP